MNNNIADTSSRLAQIKKLVSASAAKLSHLLRNEAEARAVADQAGRVVHWAWPEIIMGFCFASALQTATLWCQIQLKLPPIMNAVSVAISLSFASIFVAKYIASKFPHEALVLEQAGVLFTVTAFFAAITVSLPKLLVIFAWFIYALSFVTIIVCNFFF